MAGPSDKARFYLEHSVTELNELERKEVFTREEIVAIARKRSDFEHIINARGSHSSDYVRYIDYEKNLDALRRKRIKRKNIQTRGLTSRGQRTIYFLYNRATRKFPGDLGLWMQYIDYAQKEKAYKKLNEIFTAVVRLHPTNTNLWIYAAKYFMDTQADITNARSYMQRGLRFCKTSENLWLEYAKLETIYIGKIAGRRKILGLDIDRAPKEIDDNPDADMIALPDVTAEDVNPSLQKEDDVDEVALQNLASAPVLTGAIPIAIFDSAMTQFNGNPELAERYFNMFAEFDQLPCLQRILQHIAEFLQRQAPNSTSEVICMFQKRLLGVRPTSPDFPPSLRDSLEILNSAMQKHPEQKAALSAFAIRRLIPLLRICDEEMVEPVLEKVLFSSLRKYSRLLEESSTSGDGNAIVDLIESMQREGNKADADSLVRSSIKQWSSNERLRHLHRCLDT